MVHGNFPIFLMVIGWKSGVYAVYVAGRVRCTHVPFVVPLYVDGVTALKIVYVNHVNSLKMEISVNHSDDEIINKSCPFFCYKLIIY